MKKNKIKIDVINAFTAEERLTREGGEKLRFLIQENLKNGNKITLDFKETPIASVSFWDEGIAKLITKELNFEEIKKRVTFKNVLKRDWEVLEMVCKGRSK